MLHRQIHRGLPVQRGQGLASIFKSLFSTLVPLFKAGGKKVLQSHITKELGKTVAKEAGRSAVDLASSLVAGEDVEEKLQQNVKHGRKRVAEALRRGYEMDTGRPAKLSKTSSKTQTGKGRARKLRSTILKHKRKKKVDILGD